MNILKPAESINPAYTKQNIDENQYKKFIKELKEFRTSIIQSEADSKQILIRFFESTFYSKKDYYTNSFETEKIDCIIHSKSIKTPEIIIELKAPENKTAMPTPEQLNSKAFSQTILYYLEERNRGNNELKHIIISDYYRWFIFDAQEYERYFFKNKPLINEFKAWQSAAKTSSSKELFYDEIAPKYIPENISFTFFDVRDYELDKKQEHLNNNKELTALYKLFSPAHLLKKGFANDSNTLNRRFYNELLHILGLKEYSEKPGGKGKRLIDRLKPQERIPGSMLENTISYIETRNSISDFKNLQEYGETRDEQIKAIALQLVITWLNRILFLKLLEAQLLTYHNNDNQYKFLSYNKITEFDVLEELFFEVLAVPEPKRSPFAKEYFGNIPYLNSSLFEQTLLERSACTMSNLKDRYKLPLHPETALVDEKQQKKLEGELPALEYLLKFLDAYDFAGESGEKVQSHNKELINASVLGLIFEKINGYKEGSFYTPGYITEYMARETLRRAVVQKFIDYGEGKISFAKATELDDFKNRFKRIKNYEGLYNIFTEFDNPSEKIAANNLINTLKVVDPAVGSGHFLVSVLNEIISIKSNLGILINEKGEKLNITALVEKDQLIFRYHNSNDLYEYYLDSNDKPIPELQIIQESIFNHKRSIIESCLFGVDINPNSTNITRLRLWIEILKHAFYKETDIGLSLETLPNIDINIKTGNSLISRFSLDSNLKQLAQRDAKWNIFSYRNAVKAYKDSTNKETKRELERLIDEIKQNYKQKIQQNNPKLQKYYQLKQEYDYKFPENGLFAHEPEEDYGGSKEKREKEKNRLFEELQEAKNALENEKAFFENNKAFEWRFEFPEVLDDDGNFTGFDVVIGNPPYISTKDISSHLKAFYETGFHTAKGQYDLYIIFTEKAFSVLKHSGLFSYITPNTFLSNKDAINYRAFLSEKTQIIEIINLDETIFKEAKLDVSILVFKKDFPSHDHIFSVARNFIDFKNGFRTNYYNKRIINSKQHNIKINLDEMDFSIMEKIQQCKPLGEYTDISRGMEFGSNSKEIKTQKRTDTYPVIVGKSIEKYKLKNIIGYAKHNSNQLSVYKPLEIYQKPRILIQRIRNLSLKQRIIATYLNETILATNTLRILTAKKPKIDLKYLLGILNSKLINYFFFKNYNNKDIYAYQLESIPVNYKAEYEKKIRNLVHQVLSQKEQNPKADTSRLEAEIDQMVYELYGLTEEEIEIVEGL